MVFLGPSSAPQPRRAKSRSALVRSADAHLNNSGHRASKPWLSEQQPLAAAESSPPWTIGSPLPAGLSSWRVTVGKCASPSAHLLLGVCDAEMHAWCMLDAWAMHAARPPGCCSRAPSANACVAHAWRMRDACMVHARCTRDARAVHARGTREARARHARCMRDACRA